jgi:hypothetical protein
LFKNEFRFVTLPSSDPPFFGGAKAEPSLFFNKQRLITMDFFERIEEIKKDRDLGIDQDLFLLLESELREGLGLYWEGASRILEGSGTILMNPTESYFALKNNFFSLLFLYSYYRAGISGARRILYVTVNQCLRGMVTGCDNILDDEYKKTLETDLPEGGTRFRSVLDIMVSDRVLFTILLNALEKDDLSTELVLKACRLSLHGLLRSGVQEAGEEAGVNHILTPKEVLQSVHHYKTGLLFQAPWHIPQLLEKSPEVKMDSMRQALYLIGMGCQVMDDMVDLFSDLKKHRHNYVLSLLYHHGGEETREQVNHTLSIGDGLDQDDPILSSIPYAKIAASQKELYFLDKGFKTLLDPRHHFLIEPAVSFLSKRIGADLIRNE